MGTQQDNCPLGAHRRYRWSLTAASVGTYLTGVKPTAAVASSAKEICLVVCSG